MRRRGLPIGRNPRLLTAETGACSRLRSDSSWFCQRIFRSIAPFQIDLDNHEVTIEIAGEAQSLGLTLTEFKLLAQLARAPKRVFSRAELLANCLPESDALERTVDSHISKLRKKLEELGVTGIPDGVRGVGYRLWGTE